MGKLINQHDESKKNNIKKPTPIKKKKHGCLGCLGAILVFILVICVGGFFAGEYFAKQYLKVGVLDCAQILWEIKNVKADKIVTNKYDKEADLTALENNLKQQLFLKQTVKLSVNDLVEAIIPKPQEEKPATNNLDNQIGKTIHLLNESGVTEKADGIIGFVGDLYIKDNIDIARLSGYKEENHKTEYIFKITDKQLAALGYNSIDLIIEKFGASIKPLLEQYGITDIKSILQLDQIIFEETDGTIAGANAKIPVIKFTISIDARSIGQKVLQKLTDTDLGFLVNVLLPNRLYVSGQVGLNPDADILSDAIFINNMDAADMDNIFKVVSGVTKLMGSEMNLRETINNTIKNAIEPAKQYMSMIVDKKVDDHAIKIDLFDAIINFSGLNKNVDGTEKAEKLTSSDMIKTLAGVVTSESGKAINTDHAYDYQYYNSETNKVVYNAANTSKENLVDYKQEFMNEIAAKYMLNLNGKDGLKFDSSISGMVNDDITFDDLMNLFGIGSNEGGKKIELLDLLDTKNLDSVLLMPIKEQSVGINDRMMGAILNSQISTLMAGDGSLSKMEPKLEYVIVTSQDILAVKHNFIEMGLSVKVSSLLGDAGAGFGSIISNLIGDKIVLIVKMDVTPVAEVSPIVPSDPPAPPVATFLYEPTQIKYNNLTINETNVILNTIHKFGIAFDTTALLTQLEKPVRDAINKMGSVLPIALLDSSVIDESYVGKDLPTAIELPTVFSTIDQMLFKDAKDESINPDGIREVLSGINVVNKNGFEASYITNKASKTYSGFMTELQSKYYIKPIKDANGIEQPLTFDTLFSASGIANVNSFSAENFNFTEDKNGLFYDNRLVTELKPIFNDAELAALLIEKMGKSQTGLGDLLDIQEFTIQADGKLTLIIKLNIASIMGDVASKDKVDLMPAKVIFLKANIDTTNIKTDSNSKSYYNTTIEVNNMPDSVYRIMLAMLAHLNKGAANMDLDSKAIEIGRIVYDQLTTMQNSMGLTNIDYVEHGIALLSFYDFLKKALPDVGNVADEEFKGALQGLMEYDETKPNNNNYKTSELITNKILTAQDVNHDKHFITDLSALPRIAISATDKYLGETIYDMLQKDTANDKFVLEQTNIDCTSGVNLKFTFKMNGFNTGIGKLKDIVPKAMYVTVILPYNNETQTYGETSFIINKLTPSRQKILLDLVGVKQDDILKLLENVKKALDNFRGAQYYSSSDASEPEQFKTLEYVGFIKYDKAIG